MEFGEKLQQLRKGAGMTQEELAQVLFVSRTAISKWESGRGFPNIESLKAISECFSVSIDALLSGEQILAIAQQDQKEKQRTVRDLVIGLLDCGMGLLLFLPFFGQQVGDVIREMSLLALTEIQPYLKWAYVAFTALMMVLGIGILALQNCRKVCWEKSKYPFSFALSGLGVCLFMISRQPYAAVFVFAFFMIKVFVLLKRG